MKYIKYFENSNSYYTDMSRDEYVDSNKLDNTEEFVNYEKDKLDKFANSFGPSIYNEIKDMITTSYIYGDTTCIFKTYVTLCRVYKLKDDYFIVEYVNINNNLAINHERKYMKCDQFDGLLRCLNDNREYIYRK